MSETGTPLYAAFDAARSGELVSALLHWYGGNARDLPWRRSREPYSVWISEIMAQQTRIAAILPYYERFMKRFPTVQALAAAEIGDVLKAWEGLGYYSRAHNLHRAARTVAERYGGKLPGDPRELRSLPGIGAYTAGAIASIAFGRPVPAIDGNVLRVFSRVEANRADISLPATKASLASHLKRLIPAEPERVSAFAQATMELGALVCVPEKPHCGGCPVRSLCRAFELGVQGELPVKSPKRPQRVQAKTVLVVLVREPDGSEKILMRCRTERLLRGLWEFCVLDGRFGENEVRAYLASIGVSSGTGETATSPLGDVRHTFTHIIWEMSGHFCQITRTAEAAAPEGYRWIPRERVGDLAVPSALSFYLEGVKRG